jgi:hypothetical protein
MNTEVTNMTPGMTEQQPSASRADELSERDLRRIAGGADPIDCAASLNPGNSGGPLAVPSAGTKGGH